jgi:hypothetical protein
MLLESDLTLESTQGAANVQAESEVINYNESYIVCDG